MAGKAIEQARKAMRYCLGRLGPGDRFNIVRFSTEAEAFFHGLAAATPGNLARAKEFVAGWQAAGGTNFEEALKVALDTPETSGRPRLVILVTDGKPTIGETGEEPLLGLVGRAGGRNLRLFPVAIGNEINTHLLDRLAEQTRTFRTYIALGEEIESGISRFYDKIGSPVLADVRLDISGSVRTSQVYPRDMPDLYRGSTLTIVGRYQGSGAAVITLSGQVNGRAETFTFHADFPAESLDHDFLPPLWAARRVGFLLDQIRLHGEEKELVEEVARLARQYGIVTPYTSYLIVEDEKGRVRRGDLAESDMTLGGGAAAAPAAAKKQREQFAAMKDKSGAGSVRASSELQKLNQAQAVAETHSGTEAAPGDRVKIIGGRAFYASGDAWLDARVQEAAGLPLTRIAFASSDYFALLKNRPELAAVLALGRNIRFVSAGRVIEVFDAGTPTEASADSGIQVELGRVFQVFFHRALLGRLHHGGPVFFREGGGQDDLDVDAPDQVALGIPLHALMELDPGQVDAALLAEGEHVKTGAGAQRGQEEIKGRGRAVFAAAGGRLVGLVGEAVILGLHFFPAMKRDLHVHVLSPCLNADFRFARLDITCECRRPPAIAGPPRTLPGLACSGCLPGRRSGNKGTDCRSYWRARGESQSMAPAPLRSISTLSTTRSGRFFSSFFSSGEICRQGGQWSL